MGGSATKNTGDGGIVSYSSAAGVAEPTGAVSDITSRKAGGRRQRGSRHRQAKQGLQKRGPVAAQSQPQAAPRPYAMV